MNIKRLGYFLKEKYVYRRDVQKLGISFEEFSAYANNKWGDGSFDPKPTVLFGKKIKKILDLCYVQSAMEIFVDNVYNFETKSEKPFIIDCGANIGLSVIFFKRLHPNAEVIAFEADPQIMGLCEYNTSQFAFKDVTLVNAAVWTKEGSMEFLPNNSLGGKLEEGVSAPDTVSVKTISLLPYLDRKVDFLKIDIEGAEIEVMDNIKDSLGNVSTLFVEYHSTVGKPQELGKLLDTIANAGFQYYIKEAHPLMRQPFVDHTNKLRFKEGNFDLQLNIYAYRK